MFRTHPEFAQPQVPAAVYAIPIMANPGVKEKPATARRAGQRERAVVGQSGHVPGIPRQGRPHRLRARPAHRPRVRRLPLPRHPVPRCLPGDALAGQGAARIKRSSRWTRARRGWRRCWATRGAAGGRIPRATRRKRSGCRTKPWPRPGWNTSRPAPSATPRRRPPRRTCVSRAKGDQGRGNHLECRGGFRERHWRLHRAARRAGTGEGAGEAGRQIRPPAVPVHDVSRHADQPLPEMRYLDAIGQAGREARLRRRHRQQRGAEVGADPESRGMRATPARDYRFDGTISREVLENYLSRSISMEGLLNGRGDLDDNIRMLKSTGAKFIGRSLCLWGGEANLLAQPRTGQAADPQGPRGRPGDDPASVRLRDRDHAGRAGPRAGLGVRRPGPAGREAELPLRRHALPRRPAAGPVGPERLGARREPAGDEALVLLPGGVVHRPGLRGDPLRPGRDHERQRPRPGALVAGARPGPGLRGQARPPAHGAVRRPRPQRRPGARRASCSWTSTPSRCGSWRSPTSRRRRS